MGKARSRKLPRSPYFIRDEEPVVISFSGGRTSAYMLWMVIQAFGGELPDWIEVIFCNTGREMEATLAYVQKCSDMWGVHITWLEFQGLRKAPKVVTYETASRNGEPFDLLITQKSFLPNAVMRFCTIELKIKLIEKYMAGDFLTMVGVRADEPARVVKQRAKEDYCVPLADDGVTIKTIKEFWDRQNFGLDLPLMPNGISNASNCDLCFLKGLGIVSSMMIHKPELADWWIGQEEKIGATFNKDKPSYKQLKIIATDQGNLFPDELDTIPCFCGD